MQFWGRVGMVSRLSRPPDAGKRGCDQGRVGRVWRGAGRGRCRRGRACRFGCHPRMRSAVGVLVRGSVGGRVRADPVSSFEDAAVVDPEKEGEGGAPTVRPAGGEVLPEGGGDGRRGGLAADAGRGGELRHPWEHRARRGDVRRMRGRHHPHEPVDAFVPEDDESFERPRHLPRELALHHPSRRRASPPRGPGAAARSTRSPPAGT